MPVLGKVGELQEVVERQTADLGQMKERMAAMASRIGELEEDLDTARKDLIKSEDMNTRLQRDLREVGLFIIMSFEEHVESSIRHTVKSNESLLQNHTKSIICFSQNH